MKYINKKLEEFNNNLKGKHIAIIGMGVSNEPLIEYLNNFGAKITVFNNKDIEPNILNKLNKYKIKYYTGKNYLTNLRGFDMIFKSPSCRADIPEIEKALQEGATLTSEISLLLEMCPSKVIAVTGSDGKTTTTTLIYEILKRKYKCYLGGNIGIPLFTKIPEMTPDDIVVLELSSFQLMNMKKSPNIAVVTNITPNHLDIHKSYDEYIDAKKNIFNYQTKKDILVLNYDNDITRKFEKLAKGEVRFFSSKTKLSDGTIYDDKIIKICENDLRRHVLNVKDIKLRGIHNAENICAAISATRELVDIEDQIKAITEFNGIEHRLELVKTIDEVKWYNDSIASSPTRTIAGLKSFDEEIVLISGGYDKHLDYEPIAKPIIEKVKVLILIGQTAEKINGVVVAEEAKAKSGIQIFRANTLEEAVQIAKENVKPEQIVLFSPASASFDMFKNFEERGKKFKEIVNNL